MYIIWLIQWMVAIYHLSQYFSYMVVAMFNSGGSRVSRAYSSVMII